MSSWKDLLVDGMFVDCSSISIAYAANGLATINFTVYTESETPYSSSSGLSLNLGKVHFTGWVTHMSLAPSSDIDLLEWKVSATGIGCKDGSSQSGC